jgi:type IX secretion system PorP/SprF family membrane protein
MRGIITIAIVLFAGTVSAQQLALSSQYLFNEILVNPGATGGKDFIPVQVNFRKQWAAFPGSPTTQNASCHGSINNSFGFGGNLFNDASGPSRRTGMNVNGAYHINFQRDKKRYIGFGLGVSLSQHAIDVNQLTTYLPDDPAVIRGYNNKFVPDANVGVFYRHNERSFIGLSAYNLVQSNRDLFDFENTLYNPLARTYYLFGGYDFETSDKTMLKTSLLVQAIETGTVQFDVNAIVAYKNLFWVGLAYRNLDAVALLAGTQIGQFKFGYSYDYTISDIGKYSHGSHEVFLELQLYETNGGGGNWFRRIQRYAPKI